MSTSSCGEKSILGPEETTAFVAALEVFDQAYGKNKRVCFLQGASVSCEPITLTGPVELKEWWEQVRCMRVMIGRADEEFQVDAMLVELDDGIGVRVIYAYHDVLSGWGAVAYGRVRYDFDEHGKIVDAKTFER